MKKDEMCCRFCGESLKHTFVDLGTSPLANSFVHPEKLHTMEPYFPLHAYVCERCFLVQLEEFESPENIFGDYAYFASFSTSWLDHCARYVEQVAEEFKLNEKTQVIEIASNDGYLLQYFKAKNIPVLGVEPAENVAQVAVEQGIPTEVAFFNAEKAQELCSRGVTADWMVANNVLAHVPDINGFVEGFKILLNTGGVATFEFPHLLRLMEDVQFDTIYHEHFSYFSLFTARKIIEKHGLEIFHVEELSTHGGSLRLFVQHTNGVHKIRDSVNQVLEKEKAAELQTLEAYDRFAERVKELKRHLLSLLIKLKNEGKSITAYGAAAKGNTLLNYCGIRTDFIDYVMDKSPHKQGLYLPGSRIPVYAHEKLRETRPDYILILPWNLKSEIMRQLSFVKEWGCRFIIPVPEPVIEE